MPNAQTSDQMIEYLCLHNIQSNPWEVYETCAITGEGLSEAIQKLSDMVNEFQDKKPSDG